jgi:uncharacterized repeat protein (TIGR01451 family)/CSLREA domain-containing protein
MRMLPRFTLLAAVMLAGIVQGHAAIIVVDTLDDSIGNDGACSLREAILNANAGSTVWSDCAPGGGAGTTIQFDPALAGGTIELQGTPLPNVTADLIIDGPGDGPDSLTIDAMGMNRVFDLNAAMTLHMQDLTVAGGTTTLSGFPGGAMRILGGANVSMSRVRFSGNVTEGSGSNGGAVAVVGSSLSLTDCEFIDNQTYGASPGGSGGALFASSATLSIVNSTIADNRSHSGAAGGIYLQDGAELTVVNSTISGNRSGIGGGGLYVNRSTATLTHTTVAFNQAGSPPFSSLTQGIHVLGTASEPATLALENSLVIQPMPNQATCTAGGAGGSITSVGSLSTHAGCTGTATEFGAIGLLLLADNGGWTRTHGLSPNSVAVNGASDCSADFGVTIDQRGLSRPGGGSSACDVGAFEVQSDEPEADLAIVKSVAPALADPGDTVVFTLEAGNLGPDDATGVVVFDQLPNGYTFVFASADDGVYDEVSGYWTIGALGAGTTSELLIEAIVTGIDDYVNEATIAGGQYDPDSSNNIDQAEVVAVPHVTDLAIAKEVSPQEAEVDQNVTFVLTASNLGPDPATGVAVLDWLPPGYAYVSSASDVGSYDPNSGYWTIGALDAGQFVELNIEATVTGFNAYVNTATIDGDQDDPNPENNTASAGITLISDPEPIVVNTLLDVIAEDGLCSLREAVINANNGDQSGSVDCGVSDVIVFDETLSGGVIELSTQLHVSAQALSIEGPVAGDPSALTLDAMGESRVFNIIDDAEVHMRDLTLTGGQVSGSAIFGGAVRVFNGAQVEMLRVHLTGNTSLDSGGGAIHVFDASLTLIDSELRHNHAPGDNGNGGAIVARQSSIHLDGTTVAGNVAGGNGGGIDLTDAQLTAINSTFSGNQAGGNGGGIRIYLDASATIVHGTIAFNAAGGSGSGLFVHATSNSPAELALMNSLVVENTCAAPSVNASVISVGSLGTNSGCTDMSASAVAINLLALADNGGPTATHALGLDSAAVGQAGSCNADFDTDIDQRGQPRPGAESMACDVGAYEFQGNNQDRIFGNRFESELQ